MEIKSISKDDAAKIIETREPKGLFFIQEKTKEKKKYTGIDNSDGNAWVEEFKTLKECLAWLIGDYDGN